MEIVSVRLSQAVALLSTEEGEGEEEEEELLPLV